MTLDEALSEAVTGARVRCDSMPEGCYVEHLFSHGFVRCWPVDRPEDEPSRTQCGFRPHGDETTAAWSILERVPVPLPAAPAKPAIVAGWGTPPPKPESVPEPKAVLTLKDGNWSKEPLTPPAPAPNKWGQPAKGKWGEG